MIVPSKVTPLKDSILFKMLSILEEDFEIIDVLELYDRVSDAFTALDEFIFSLDVLFVMNKVRVTEEGLLEKC
ncbi:Uncharacterised protein [Serratia entomophila]|uniref:ABC-three component system middle component 7 n=1 Tax=Serratia entomophila TaxID=42906 RepID=UPI00217A5EEC|nr:ABC-three component system middle component 7 [Serratia entomophila]CAI0972253.1 Uncharacterised protein [Serratia entomophila]CAI1748281.1 Uncharacterised protein [Serratia entomophila]CAI1807413.1 Uncharacterised protein [Serratia entomophila]